MSAAPISTRAFATMNWVPPPSMSCARRVSSASWRCGDDAGSGSSMMSRPDRIRFNSDALWILHFKTYDAGHREPVNRHRSPLAGRSIGSVDRARSKPARPTPAPAPRPGPGGQMTTYQPYSDFTAQSRTVSALMSMYGQLERGGPSRIELTPIVVFLGFSIESYLNSIGARKVSIWEELEHLPWRRKIAILHKTADRAPEWGKDPLQFANEVFALRDRLAHGKPERIVGPKFRTEAEAARYLGGPELNRGLQPEWYAGITEDWVMKAKERFRLLMIYLGGLFGFHESDHLLSSTGGWLVDDEK